MTGIVLLYSTFKSRDEAVSAARRLLEARLVACANVIDGVTSLYRWEGKMQEEGEVVMTAKTTRDKAQAAIDEIARTHAYDVPCVIALPVESGFAEFLTWVAGECR